MPTRSSSRNANQIGNIVFIVAMVIIALLLANKYLLRPRDGELTRAENQLSLKTGARLSIPGIEWSVAKQTLIIALAPECDLCRRNAQFYSEVNGIGEVVGETRLIAVVPETNLDVKSYVEELGLSADEVINVDFKSLGINHAPALILVDDGGTIKKVWPGYLTAHRRQEVLSYLGREMAPLDKQLIAESESISADELVRLIKAEKGVMLLDVREREEYANSHISGAKNIPADELQMRAVRELPDNYKVVTYCGCQGLAQVAARKLNRMGFEEVFMLDGSEESWNQAGLALVSSR